MTDQRVEERLGRVSRALAESSPQPPPFPDELPSRRSWSGPRVAVVAFAGSVVVFGAIGLFALLDGSDPAVGDDGLATVQPIVVSTDPLVVLAQYGPLLNTDGEPGMPESSGLTPLESLDQIGDLLVVGGGYSQPELAAAGFIPMISGFLDLNPLAEASEPVVVLGAVGEQVLVKWEGTIPDLESTPVTCIAVIEGNGAGISCGERGADHAALSLSGTTATFIGAVPRDTAWVELERAGELIAWQVPRSDSVSIAIPATRGDEITTRLFDIDGDSDLDAGMARFKQPSTRRIVVSETPPLPANQFQQTRFTV